VTLSDADAQTLILAKVGDIDPVTGDPLQGGLNRDAGVVGAYIPLLWSSHADKTQVSPRLRELYVERDSYDLILGTLSALVDHTFAGETIHLSQRVGTIKARRFNTQLEINQLQKFARGRRAPAVGQILTVEPVSPPTSPPAPTPFGPDANSPAYAGSPYLPTRVRQS
jgi:hypothetical protein